jgi:hypothetical protein
MQRRFTRFVEQPTRDNYLSLRQAILRTTPLPLTSAELTELALLLEAGLAQEVLDRMDALPPSKAISPRVHFLAAEAAEMLGDADTCELERFLFVLCLKGLLATGSGTSADPYFVAHACDEYDILESLGLEAAGQSLVEKGPRIYDLILCTDGREMWFDVTDLLHPPKPIRKRSAAGKTALRRAKPRPARVSQTRR